MLTDRQRRNLEAMRREGRAAGDLNEIEEDAASLLPERRFDVVDMCPASKLADLAAEHPELIDEIARRRWRDVEQL
jgi:hypothetical protein